MDITNSTDIDTEYRVTSPETTTAEPEWKRLGPSDYAIVNPREEGPWTVELRVRGNGSVAEVVDNPRASVVLEETAGKYRVHSSVASLDAFLMDSPPQQEWAEKLGRALRDSGLSIWSSTRDLKPGLPVRRQLEKAVGEAKGIVALIGPEAQMTERQSLERAIVLEAIWRDPGKRLVPLLVGDPELPSFVRAASNWTRRVVAIRVEDTLRDWDKAISDLVQVLKGEADPRERGELIDTLEEDRRLFHERLDYIGEVVAEWKRLETQGK
jgi:hypothetical protein